MPNKKQTQKEANDITLDSLQEACIMAGDRKGIILAFAQGYAAGVTQAEAQQTEKQTETKEQK